MRGRWAVARRQTTIVDSAKKRREKREEKPAGSFVSASQRQGKLSYCYTSLCLPLLSFLLSLYSTTSISPLSLSSRHTVLPPPLPTKRQPTRGGQGKSREEKRVPSAPPPIPFCSNRRRRPARDPLRVPRRRACPLAEVSVAPCPTRRRSARGAALSAARFSSSVSALPPRYLFCCCGFPPRSSVSVCCVRGLEFRRGGACGSGGFLVAELVRTWFWCSFRGVVGQFG